MGRRLILLLAGVGGLIVVLAVGFKLVGGTYRAPSESMAPTLRRLRRLALLGPGPGGLARRQALVRLQEPELAPAAQQLEHGLAADVE
jgi:hypothetical protein